MSNFLIIMQPYAEESSPIRVYGSPGRVPNLIDTISEFKREKMSWNLLFSFTSLSFPPLSIFLQTICESKVFFSFYFLKKNDRSIKKVPFDIGC